MRGFLSGIIWGVVVAGFALAGLSLMNPMAPRPDAGVAAPESASGAQDSAADSGVKAGAGDPAPDETLPEPPKAGGAKPDDVGAVDDPASETAQRPEATPRAEDLNDPGEAPQASGVDLAADQPVGQSDAAQPPAAPQQGETPSQSSAPAAEPEVTQTAPATLPATSGTDATQGAAATQVLPGTDAEIAASATATHVEELSPETGPVAQTTPSVAQPAEKPQPAAQPEAETQENSEQPAATTREDTDPETDQSNSSRVVVRQNSSDQGEELRPSIGKRVVPLTERNAAASGDSASGSGSDSGDATVVSDENAPPLERYAVPFDNPENKPLMAIILIDDTDAVGIEALKEFPYPLTFAIDPAAPDAGEKMARHRAAGFEVVALVDLPKAATASDAEVALAAGFATLDQAVAVLEGADSGVQGNRDLSDQVTAFVAATGRGVITQDTGLNTAHKLAVRAGTPSAVVFRDFDGQGQKPEIMRRYLDQAAFRAGRDGAVVMMGRLRPDTISALLLWGLQDKASRVKLAPVSAVIKAAVE